MDLKYFWRFDVPQCADEGGLEKVVKIVPWTLVATDGERTFEKSDRLALPEPDAKDFVPFEKITLDMMIDWVANNPALDVPYLQAQLVADFTKRVPAPPAPQYPQALPFESAR